LYEYIGQGLFLGRHNFSYTMMYFGSSRFNKYNPPGSPRL
jgi:hypothetical protein